MRFDRRILRAIVSLVGSLIAGAQVHAQAPTRDQQMMMGAQMLNEQGRYAEAAAKYEEMIAAFPQAPVVPEAWFRAGYSHYRATNYDGAMAAFRKVIDDPKLPPAFATLKEMSMKLFPEVMLAKASKLDAGDPRRPAALEEVVKSISDYLGAYPRSGEVESTKHTLATVLVQLEKFDEAVQVLRENVKEFAASPTVEASQYSLAQTLATMAGREMAQPNPDTTTAKAQFEESAALLTGIVKENRDLARANDAQFQLGELFGARMRYLRGDTNKQQREACRARAVDAYQAVAGKDRVVAAQRERIKSFKEEMIKAGVSKDAAGFQKFKHLVGKETERLADIERMPDQVPVARSRIEALAP